MKRFGMHLMIPAGVAVCLLGLSSTAQATVCYLADSPLLDYSGPRTLSVPRDTPDGTVLYSERMWLPKVSFECGIGAIYGIHLAPGRGTQPARGSLFPTGASNLAFRWRFPSGTPMPVPYPLANAIYYTIGGGLTTLEIVKVSSLEPSSTIKAGDLGALKGAGVPLVRLGLSNPIHVVPISCESPDVRVAMGNDYTSSDFDGPGSRTQPVSFNLTLNNCPPGINNVSYKLKAVTPVVDASQGIVALNDGSSAVGIGLQIRNGDDVPLALDTAHAFSAYDKNGGTFQISMKANYYRLYNERVYKAGTANSEIAFVMSYM